MSVGVPNRPDELRGVMRACRRYFVLVAFFSLAINLLYLASPLYMLQVYDRVISSSSVVTLVMLTIALMIAFVVYSGLDVVRARILARLSVRLDTLVAPRIIEAVIDSAGMLGGARSQYLRDFDSFRQFVTGMGINAVFDLPWAPIYILVIFLLHPALGLFALVSAVLLVILALINERMVRTPISESNMASARNYNFTEMSLRNYEVVQAMGMTDGLLRRWSRDRDRMIDAQMLSSDRSGNMQSLIRFLRLSMQSLILGLGAWLVIEREATVGAMFAASILLARALQPIEQIVGSWRGLISALDAYGRVRTLLFASPRREARMEMPRPSGALAVANLTCVPARGAKPALRNVSFRIEAGEVLGIIGPSGAGKSTLCRHIAGVMAPMAGEVRLDGAELSHYSRSSLGRYFGYLPQDIELFSDSVAANIGRFAFADAGAIIAAAQLAGVHEMILGLSDGYETQVGEGGMILSAGIRQRIALARAVFGDPSLVVLDEPSSNLDAEGDAALSNCIMQLKKKKVSVLIVSHRPATIGVVDKILLLRDGAVDAFGSRPEILARIAPQPLQPARNFVTAGVHKGG